MNKLQTFLVDGEITYTGRELAPHWIYKNFDMAGDAMIAFIGPCLVELDAMIDLKDVKEQASIYSPKMLHFITEFFDTNLEMAVYRQRLLMIIIKEQLESLPLQGSIIRNGDDLFYVSREDEKGKMTVSIATRSTVSTLIHVGINIETEGTPVKTAGLGQLRIKPTALAKAIMKSYSRELEGIYVARCKVRGI